MSKLSFGQYEAKNAAKDAQIGFGQVSAHLRSKCPNWVLAGKRPLEVKNGRFQTFMVS